MISLGKFQILTSESDACFPCLYLCSCSPGDSLSTITNDLCLSTLFLSIIVSKLIKTYLLLTNYNSWILCTKFYSKNQIICTKSWTKYPIYSSDGGAITSFWPPLCFGFHINILFSMEFTWRLQLCSVLHIWLSGGQEVIVDEMVWCDVMSSDCQVHNSLQTQPQGLAILLPPPSLEMLAESQQELSEEDLCWSGQRSVVLLLVQ